MYSLTDVSSTLQLGNETTLILRGGQGGQVNIVTDKQLIHD